MNDERKLGDIDVSSLSCAIFLPAPLPRFCVPRCALFIVHRSSFIVPNIVPH
jgi:hypothetical protein